MRAFFTYDRGTKSGVLEGSEAAILTAAAFTTTVFCSFLVLVGSSCGQQLFSHGHLKSEPVMLEPMGHESRARMHMRVTCPLPFASSPPARPTATQIRKRGNDIAEPRPSSVSFGLSEAAACAFLCSAENSPSRGNGAGRKQR